MDTVSNDSHPGQGLSQGNPYLAMRNDKQAVLDNYDHYLKRNQ